MRLIDADALSENVQFRLPNDNKNAEIIDGCVKITRRLVENAPTIEAEPVRRGRWVSDEADILFHCSECETQVSTNWDYEDLQWNYCPNCGAKMDGGKEDD